MSYIRQTWIDNQTTVTAAHMQHIEDGIIASDARIDALQHSDEDQADTIRELEVDRDQLKADLNEVAYRDTTSNLLDLTTVNSGYYDLDGNFHESSSYVHSDIIDVSKLVGQTLFFCRDGNQGVIASLYSFITEYNENGSPIRITSAKNLSEYTVPSSGVASIILSATTSNLSELSMLNVGEMPTHFIPHGDGQLKPTGTFISDVQKQIDDVKNKVDTIGSVESAEISNVTRLGSSSVVTIVSVDGNTVEFTSTSGAGGFYFNIDKPLEAGKSYIIWGVSNVANSEPPRLYVYRDTTVVRYIAMDVINKTNYFVKVDITESDSANRFGFVCRNDNWNGSITLYIADVTNADDLLLARLNRPNGYITFGEPMNVANSFGSFYGKIASFIGDSNTAYDRYEPIVKRALGLADYTNCGVSGSSVGGTSEDAFWRDSRANAVNLNSDLITIMGGTNDSASSSVGIGDVTIDNHDTSTFVGAYNVLISKLMYKFYKTNGFYSDVDYSAITQTETQREIQLVLMTPIYSSSSQYQHSGKLEQLVDAVKQIGTLWNVPVIDTYHSLGFNSTNASIYYRDGVHLNLLGGQLLGGYIANQLNTMSRM